jgi:hypothetical protein
VDRALGTAAVAGRFAESDVLRILAHQAGRDINKPIIRASEAHGVSQCGQPAQLCSRRGGSGMNPLVRATYSA